VARVPDACFAFRLTRQSLARHPRATPTATSGATTRSSVAPRCCL